MIALSDRDFLRIVESSKSKNGTTTTSSKTNGAARSPLFDVNQLIEDIKNDHVSRVRGALRTLAITVGPKKFVTDVAHPLAVAIGLAWERGLMDVHREHLATELVSTQLRLLLSAFEDGEAAPVIVLATMPGEAHALGLEMVGLYLSLIHICDGSAPAPPPCRRSERAPLRARRRDRHPARRGA